MKKYFINVIKMMGVMLGGIAIMLILFIPAIQIGTEYALWLRGVQEFTGKSLWWCCLYLILPFISSFEFTIEIKTKNEM